MKDIDLKDLGGKIRDAYEELGELDQDNIGSWPTWAYAGVMIIVAVVILGAGSWYFVLPKKEKLHEITQHEQELKQTFINKHEKVSSLDEYRAQVRKMHKQFQKQLSQLPTKTEIPSLIRDISQMRLASGLQEKLFKPRPTIDKGFYTVLPNAMTVTGQYHELAEFVSRIASLPRIVTIDDVSIKPIKSDVKGELRMSMTIKTYRYNGNKGSG